jgi:hypothetical protein
MANTNLLKTRVEPFVREWLAKQYSQTFSREFLQLAGCSGSHEFDAVSADKRIVCGIKSSSGATSGGKNPSGKIASAYEELYFLAGVDADQRFLVLTDKEFYQLLSRKMQEKLSRDIKLFYCPLTEELARLVRAVQSEASSEIDRGKPSARAKD